MRTRLFPVAGVGAVALVAAATFASTATANSTRLTMSHQGGVLPVEVQPMKRGNCYSSLHRDTGVSIVSQTFGDYPEYDSTSADNFAVKKTCKVTGATPPASTSTEPDPRTPRL